ncbi:acetate/propionate family kinase [Cereibacter sphaeroides]|uniref:acetate/propionate family kinase n=1 Tax=Cereibacter sphaeroides TaxID=1063 RepID=UPI000191C2E9|nr:acetate/propionate family kinase [Cereibacter sphaeroides]ACM02513.1 Acetate kinase [Cereibacter sphaeroides KD131]
MKPVWLVLNIGSSTVKFGLFDVADARPLVRGLIEGIGLQPRLKASLPDGTLELRAPADARDAKELTLWLLGLLEGRLGPLDLHAAGHRVVHGGPDYNAPVLLTPEVFERLESFSPLAPSHQPFNLAGVRAVEARWPGVPQIACFDTAFHHDRPRLARLYALPRAMAEEGILRYGFHGLSYDYIASRLPEVLGETGRGKVIVAHLGSGASLCAMENLRSLDTTMGFSALDGLMMGTRCGQLDPGVILHFLRQGLTGPEIETILGKQSGLAGVSGISPDMRDLLASDRPEAAEAVDLFVRFILRQIGALSAGMGGLDALVFTAGIGQHAPEIRARVMEGLGWLGLEMDAAANGAGQAVISAPGSRVKAAVIATDEEEVILRALHRGEVAHYSAGVALA